MTVEPTIPLACPTSCPAEPFLRALLEKVESIEQTLKNIKPNVEKSSKTTTRRPNVNWLIVALQLKYPDRGWTAGDFAKKIGCSETAVRKTTAWKEYRIRCESKKQNRTQRKGYRDKMGNFGAFCTDG